MSAAPTTTPEGQLEWEARNGPRAAVAAFVSAGLALGSMLLQIVQIGTPPDGEREALLRFDEHRTDFFVSLGLQVASYFLLAAALFYLLRATMYRRAETPSFSLGLLALAPILLGVGGLLNQLELNDVTDQFLSSGERTDKRAEDLLDDRNILGGALGSGGTLCLALSFVLISLNAMRAGLLSRFMGALGMIVGGLLILPILPGGQSTVQIFWVAALGVLFLGRWPNGRGPAWEAGQAVPWPSAAEIRGDVPEAAGPAEPAAEADPAGEEDAPPPRRSRKRKKKPR